MALSLPDGRAATSAGRCAGGLGARLVTVEGRKRAVRNARPTADGVAGLHLVATAQHSSHNASCAHVKLSSKHPRGHVWTQNFRAEAFSRSRIPQCCSKRSGAEASRLPGIQQHTSNLRLSENCSHHFLFSRIQYHPRIPPHLGRVRADREQRAQREPSCPAAPQTRAWATRRGERAGSRAQLHGEARSRV